MQIYDKLLGLPLFQGMSSSDLQDVVTRVKFGFNKYSRNTVVVDEGDPCTGILFLLDGDVEMTTTSADHSFSITEFPVLPHAIEPERVFGLQQRYSQKYITKTQCNAMIVGKDDIVSLASEFMVFRLNLLNILSTNSQRLSRQIWKHTPAHTESRIVEFLRAHSSIPSGKKIVHTKMQQLAYELNESRIDVSVALNKLHDEGKIVLQRGIITVPKLEIL